MTKHKVGFIMQPLEIEHLYNAFGPDKELLKKMISPEIMKDIIKYAEPFVYVNVDNICSATGEKIEGFIVAYPYLPIELFREDRQKAIEKLLKACRLAEQEGADIIVLTSFISMLANEGKAIADNLKIAVTSGENYLASTVIQGIKNAINFMEIKEVNTAAAILGATTNIGRVCSIKLADYFNEIRLYSQNQKEINLLEEAIKSKRKAAKIVKAKDCKEAIKGAKVVLVTTSPYTVKLDNADIESGSILCDVSIPPQTAKNLLSNRTDVLSFDGRFAEMKIEIENEKWHRIFPRGVIFSRLAEGIILGFENKFVNYSLGKDTITEDKVDEITKMAEKHGFKSAAFRIEMEKFSVEYLHNIKSAYFNIAKLQ